MLQIDSLYACPYPSVPLYADMTLSSEFIVEGTIASYKCNEGYELFGTATRSCAQGKWQGTVPYCGKSFPNYS